jgi:peptide/nickel transport system permease protein
MSSEIYELMKRSDEGAVVEKAHRRPRFVEDCVREMIRQVTEAFPDLRERAFVERARALGAGDTYIIKTHILPNTLPLIFANTVLIVAVAILSEAALSFLSIGVQPPNASWGTIIGDGQELLYTRPWVAIAPGIMIVLTVLSLNVLGDGVRDALDPRAKVRVRE